MRQLIEYITLALSKEEFAVANFAFPAYAVKLFILLCVAAIVHIAAIRVVLPIIEHIVKKTKTTIDDFLIGRNAVKRTFHIIPATIVAAGLPIITNIPHATLIFIKKGVNLYFILIALSVFDAVLNAMRDIYDAQEKHNKIGVTGAFQALKVVGVIVAIILAVSALAGKSPVYLLSGLGAFTAILMLIFKDPIMGLAAGVQLSAMDMVRKGDWIEIPKHGADGSVEDISLTTVKVRNWDMTITAIPAYELVSSSFKNWRAMSESGGRRIKRSIRFNINTIRFITNEDIERLRKIKLLNSYFNDKLAEIDGFNAAEFSNADMLVAANGRRLTNIGTFRAYCEAYLRKHPGINKDLTVIVRQLGPTEFGIPLEIYAFTCDVRWAVHENVQSDIFDHLLAIIPEFDLAVYQR